MSPPVHLPDLPPDLSFVSLSRTEEAEATAFAFKRAAMAPHIAPRWGWDEAVQRAFHHDRFVAKPFDAILRGSEAIGTRSFEVAADHVRLGEFYLLPVKRPAAAPA